MSPFGIDVRAQDDLDGSLSAGTDATNKASILAACIEQAAVQINMKLFQRYTAAVCAASTWCKWCNAYLACLYLCQRRNNPPPDSVLAECEQFQAELTAIFGNHAHLISDNGLANPKYDQSPTVTNYTIDSRYARGKVRRVPVTSTGGGQGGDRKKQDMREYIWWN